MGADLFCGRFTPATLPSRLLRRVLIRVPFSQRHMSIALSAVIRPSRVLRLALFAFGLAGMGAAMALVAWQPARFHFPHLLAAVCLAASAAVWFRAVRPGNPRRIDISGLGEIRLSVQQSLGAEGARDDGLLLLPGSTVWPSLLILLLREGGSGTVSVAVILPDSVPRGQFRKIAVSIIWIARRDNKFSENNKIL